MRKEKLLDLLGPGARAAFDGAKRLACSKGGVLSPLHILVVLLGTLEPAPGHLQDERARLLQTARDRLSALYSSPSKNIIVTKETQEVIKDAGRLAEADSEPLASPLHLLRAVLASPTVKGSLEGELQPDSSFDQLFARAGEAVSSLQAPEAERRPDKTSAGRTAVHRTRELGGALGDFCTDLAEETMVGSPHPFFGREREITAALETLCRKLKNNPLLIGRPGVGKTALVAAVALKLCQGDVPRRLQGKRILEVSRLRLLADAKFTGDIEERLKRLLEDVREAGDVILFFDEIHTLLGAGGSVGTGDIANLIKSSLSKGEIVCIGATTLAEYYKHIARDEALARRFSTITIEEPSIEETRRILAHARGAFESYHSVKIADEEVALIVDMADRYLHSRSFPDKAFDLIDKAAAKAALAGRDRLSREVVAETLSEMTGMPLEIMDEEPSERLARLEEFLNSVVPGQEQAARDIARVVRIAKLGLELRPERPDGVFLFIGQKGAGKHEMAIALAKFLYGSPSKMIEFEMSQFTESWSISRLVGAEPGYVGYSDRSGLLSKAAEDHPHSVLYFRHVDLAHEAVQQFLADAFQRGRFTDATGARISLSNITVVMSLARANDNNRPAQVGFFARAEEDVAETGALARTQEFGLVEPLAATIDEVIEFRVLSCEATEKIIAEQLEMLCARLEAACPVLIEIDSGLARFFVERLAAERKSLAQLERMWQETIIVPFTHLRIDRRTVGARPKVAIRVEGTEVKVDIEYC
ncbi:MAG: ATP-dependent Clp protease ATP-binding subunit [Blastocatellia bacterium]|nr:ATP-dependent Clp protease ATP-binding subunit [Blastocatellia bacterium]